LEGVTANNFNDEAQLAFRETVADVTNAEGPDDVTIDNFRDIGMRRRRLIAGLLVAFTVRVKPVNAVAGHRALVADLESGEIGTKLAVSHAVFEDVNVVVMDQPGTWLTGR
jgi:hypothetical protein